MRFLRSIFALVFAVALVASSVSAHEQSTQKEWDLDEFVRSLPPKDSLQTVAGIKTYGFEVPPPITRTHNAIVTYEMTAVEKEMQIAQGVTHPDVWTFDGTVQGPTLRVLMGDVVDLTLKNHSDNDYPHNIDLHAVHGPGGGAKGTLVVPGESRRIQFRATHPGAYIYHCASSGDIPRHIANGMYGLIIVDPKEPYASRLPVMREFALVQGEYYLPNVSAKENYEEFVTAQKELIAAEHPTFVVFNGKHKDLHKPLVVKDGEMIRLYVGSGVGTVSSFHVISTVFDKAYVYGGTIDKPLKGVQTVTVLAGGSAIVEFRAVGGHKGDGFHLAVDHILARTFYKGAGVVFKVVGAASPELYEEMSPPAITGDLKGGH